MGQFLQVNGDYNIKSAEGGKITFDTGPAGSGGQVLITGNLVVEGTQTTVQATDLDVSDNIITLNAGETGAGVTLIYSGIEVDRGSLPSASLLYDETADTWLIANGNAPSLNYDDSNIRLHRIYTNPSTDDGDLVLIGAGTGVVKVIGTINYEEQVTADDDIPNKRYVDDAIQNNPTFQIVAPQLQDTRVIISDKEITPNISTQAGSLAYLTANTGFNTFGDSAVSIVVDGQLVSQFYSNRAEIGDLEIGGGTARNEISNKASITNENIFIRTQGTGKLQTNYALQLEKIAVVPAYVANNTIVYGAAPELGTTGVWFVNDSLESSKRTGELISKNKALVFSMIF
jgi:hypothetical protein